MFIFISYATKHKKLLKRWTLSTSRSDVQNQQRKQRLFAYFFIENDIFINAIRMKKYNI